jgi:predicted phage baseplate assembly protein
MMALPTPNLDDRTFQELVDDAKRLIQEHCPEWTDHNVSDPGVTLVEVFAWMTEQLIYRLNRVPERMFLTFLELLGLRLNPPVAATADVLFWLSARRSDTVMVERGTIVATTRSENEPAVAFTVTEELAIVPCSAGQVLTSIQPNTFEPHPELLGFGAEVRCFDAVPKRGDALFVGLSTGVPSCVIDLRLACGIAEGHGVDPLNPPLVWEALTNDGWDACEVLEDRTGGLNRSGDVQLAIPRGHVMTSMNGVSAGWVRCTVTDTIGDQRPYGGSPVIEGVEAFTMGGVATTSNIDRITLEKLGVSTGVSGQRFQLAHRPVVPTEEDVIVEVDGPNGWEPWTEVETFADSGKDDRHFTLDRVQGEVAFGPAVREPDGSFTAYGAVPALGATMRASAYSTGGGTRGNVAAGTIRQLKTSIPAVRQVENRRPARGGLEAEDLPNAKVRGPMLLRGTRAVAARDFEHQVSLVAGEQVARVLCMPVQATDGGADVSGAVRVLITPTIDSDELGRLPFVPLKEPDDRLLARIAQHLDERRVVGVRVAVVPPLYTGLTVEARLRAGPRVDHSRLEHDALRALYRYFDPIGGGPDGRGWPFGRPVHAGEAFWVLQQVSGVAFVEDARLFPSNPITRQRGEEVDRLELEPDALVFSFEHRVEVIGTEV